MDAKKYAILCNKSYEDGFKSIRHNTHFIECKETDTQVYEVIGVEMFEKAFHKVGDNMSILIKPK